MITLVLCSAMPVVAFGQTQENDEQAQETIEYPPRFQVDLIVFIPVDPTPGNEQFDPPYDPFSTDSLDELDALLSEIGDPDDFAWEDPATIADTLAGPPGDDENAAQLAGGDLATERSGEPAADLEDGEEPEPGRELQIIEDEEQWQLADVIERLNDSRDFQLLTYQVWQQDGILFDETEPFVLQSVDDDAGKLEGAATLSLSRFLHLLVEIDWLPPGKNERYSLYPGFAGLITKPTPYSIRESRLVRGGAIHYFDHPHFGVVALITRIEEPEPELDEDGNPIVPTESERDNTAASTS
ncbi:MAG: CsiV family protein [Proteobacteria bacterium]|nr:CsiV family protein [Pseudomonadota bacterium]